MSFKRGRRWFLRPNFLGEDSEIIIKRVEGSRIRIYDCWLRKYLWVSVSHLRHFYYPRNLRLLAVMDMKDE